GEIAPQIFDGVRTANVQTESRFARTLLNDKKPAGLVFVASMSSVAALRFLGAQVETEKINIGINFGAVERCFDNGARWFVLLAIGYVCKIALLSQIYFPVFHRPFGFVCVND